MFGRRQFTGCYLVQCGTMNKPEAVAMINASQNGGRESLIPMRQQDDDSGKDIVTIDPSLIINPCKTTSLFGPSVSGKLSDISER